MSETPHRNRWLAWILALYPRRFQERFGSDIQALYDESAGQPGAARQLLFDLLKNVLATHVDDLRLQGRQRRQRRQLGLELRQRQATPRPEASMMDSLLRDSRYASRRLLRAPAMTLIAVATLALGIGGTTAIFSVINGVLLQPLSAPEPERLMQVFESSESRSNLPVSYDTFRDYQAQSQAFEHLAVLRAQSVAVTGGDAEPERIRGLFVSASFFDALGEAPTMGRQIEAGEDVPGGPRTVVLSHGFWQRRFGADPKVLGKTVKLNNEDHTIVGVMDAEFRFPYDTSEAWISLQTFPGTLDRDNRTLFVMGRLAAGIATAEAAEEMALLSANLATAHPESQRDVSAQVAPLIELFVGDRMRQMLAILAASVAMVLLIGAANVANLQLAQATGRGREMAIRTAVGADRSRLLGQLLIENLMLAVAGGLVGVAVAYGGVKLLITQGPGWMRGLFEITPNFTVLAFALLVSLCTGVLFGLVPGQRAARVDLIEGLQEGGRGNGPGLKSGRLRGALVIAQTALAVMLVIASGLLLRSFSNLTRVEVGFQRDGLMTMQFRLPNNKYDSDEKVVQYFDQMLERVSAVPGVSGVAAAEGMPFTGDEGRSPLLADGIDPGPDVEVPLVRTNFVSPNYFRVLGIPLISGRSLEPSDQAGNALAVVVSAQAAKQLWPEASQVIGRTLKVRGQDDVALTVVGVVADIYNRGLRTGVDPLVYISHRQVPQHFATMAARVHGDPYAYTEAIRQAIWSLDPDLPLWEVMTQNERIALWTSQDRFAAILLGVFALIAITLAAIGIGGVIAYSVVLRRRELGVRLSLGATRVQIIHLVMSQGLRLVGLGVILGVVGAAALGHLLSSALFGVGAIDPVIYLTTPILLLSVAALATLVPACRAAWLDPIRTLRED